jgi:hypothetical protein
MKFLRDGHAKIFRNPDVLVLVPAYPPPMTVLDALLKVGFHLWGSYPLDPEVCSFEMLSICDV